MKKAAAICFAASALAACNDHRDLYVAVYPDVYVEGNWGPSLGKSDMTMNATAVAYGESGGMVKEYFFKPDNVYLKVDRGTYDIMIFNGLMYAPADTHLDGIYFRGTEAFETFEAVAAETPTANKRLNRAEGEYVATNNMEIFTSATERCRIDRGREYFIKYKNGRNGFDIPETLTEAELDLTPQAMTYPCRVKFTITNISSAYAANAAIYGFSGSAYVATRRPTEFMVTHQFNVNNKMILSEKDDIGTIESRDFNTFGPPLDMTGRKCKVLLSIVLVNGDTFEKEFDVTDQVLPFVLKVKENLAGTEPVEYRMNLPIDIALELPIIKPVEGVIGVGDWDDDEIITVPIKP